MMKSLDRCPGELPDVQFADDDSVTYSMVVGLPRGLPARLVMRYTPSGDLFASIDRTSPAPKRS
jgi:hypothetical protein